MHAQSNYNQGSPIASLLAFIQAQCSRNTVISMQLLLVKQVVKISFVDMGGDGEPDYS